VLKLIIKKIYQALNLLFAIQMQQQRAAAVLLFLFKLLKFWGAVKVLCVSRMP